MLTVFFSLVELRIFENRFRGSWQWYKCNFGLTHIWGAMSFFFCNKKKDGIKVLRYDQNGFVLATKKLLDDMKFQWPKTPNDVKELSFQQVEWLLQGLEIEQKKAHHEVKISSKNSCF